MLSGGRVAMVQGAVTPLQRLDALAVQLLASVEEGTFLRETASATRMRSLIGATHGRDGLIANALLRPLDASILRASSTLARECVWSSVNHACVILDDAFRVLHDSARLMDGEVLRGLLQHQSTELGRGARWVRAAEQFVTAYQGPAKAATAVLFFLGAWACASVLNRE